MTNRRINLGLSPKLLQELSGNFRRAFGVEPDIVCGIRHYQLRIAIALAVRPAELETIAARLSFMSSGILSSTLSPSLYQKVSLRPPGGVHASFWQVAWRETAWPPPSSRAGDHWRALPGALYCGGCCAGAILRACSGVVCRLRSPLRFVGLLSLIGKTSAVGSRSGDKFDRPLPAPLRAELTVPGHGMHVSNVALSEHARI